MRKDAAANTVSLLEEAPNGRHCVISQHAYLPVISSVTADEEANLIHAKVKSDYKYTTLQCKLAQQEKKKKSLLIFWTTMMQLLTVKMHI